MKINNHRTDFKTCPYCDHKQDYKEWRKCATGFSAKEYFGKHNSGVVVSTCPKCSGESWIHVELSHMQYAGYSKKSWIKKAEIELAKRKLVALREWGAGMCWRCKHLEDGSVTTNAWRHCIIGSGPAQITCDRFEQL